MEVELTKAEAAPAAGKKDPKEGLHDGAGSMLQDTDGACRLP